MCWKWRSSTNSETVDPRRVASVYGSEAWVARSGVKGTAMESVVADVARLLERGAVTRDYLEARLSSHDLAVLDGGSIQASQWYSLEVFGSLTQLLLEKEGENRVEYLLERGRRAGKRIAALGIYSQTSATQETWGDGIGKIMVSLGPAMYLGTEWHYDTTDGGGLQSWLIRVRVPAEFPDVCRYSTQGFIEYMGNDLAKANVRLDSERVSATEIIFNAEPE